MHPVFRTASCATLRHSFLLKTSPIVPPASSLFCGKQLICLSSTSTAHKSAAKNRIKNGAIDTPPKFRFSSIPPLPTPPLPPKGRPPIINTHDIEKYVQPLYARGWGLSPILPNGNGIAVLRKRFEFANAKALERFLADLSEYEEEKKHHAKTDVYDDQHRHAVLVSTWTHVARRSDGKVEDTDKDEKIHVGVTARDIRLAYALEELFERSLVVRGREYVPHVRPEADRPKTVDELNGYT